MRVLAVVVAVAGCGRIGFGAQGQPADALPDGDGSASVVWGIPVALVNVQSTADDWEPALSPDGTMLVFNSDRVAGEQRLFVSLDAQGVWLSPTQITSLNQAGSNTEGGAWNASGTELYFSSNRSGNDQLYVSVYDGQFQSPTVAPGLAGVSAVGPCLRGDGLEIVFNTGGSAQTDLMHATRSSVTAAWDPPTPVTELNTSVDEGWPTLTADGLTIYFESNRVAGQADIYQATRAALDQPFGPATPVVELSDPMFEDGDPDLSSDGRRMLIGSKRQGGAGASDLFEATRVQ